MSDATPDRAWAGRTVFPRSTAELRSTTSCPACWAPLTATICATCGLDLRHPAAAELAVSSAAIADALDARLDLIGRIRRDSATAAFAAASAVSPTSPAAGAAGTAVAAGTADPSAPPATPTPPAAPPAAGGRSGIQIALIVVGITLLSVFAVFGLVYAFVTVGADVRMAIIVGGTLATMIAAAVLARRGLRSTGEGVAVLGTVMLALDAWALRLNDPMGLGATEPLLYWGTALVIVGATAAVWARTSSLASPGVAAAGLVPIGAALLAGHAIDTSVAVAGAAVFTAAVIALAVSSSSALAAPNVARARRAAAIVARAVGAAAGTVALVSVITIDPAGRLTPALAGGILTATTLLHIVALDRAPDAAQSAERSARNALDRATLLALGGGAALASTVGAIVAAARFDQERVAVSAPLIAAVLVAVAAEQAWQRVPVDAPARLAFAAATLTAAFVAALAGGLSAIVGAAAFIEASTQTFETLALMPSDRVASAEPATIAALGALALCLGIVAAGWAMLGILDHRARALTAIAAVVIVAIVPLLPFWWLVMLVYAALAITATASIPALGRMSEPDARRALLALLSPLGAGAALGAYAVGWAVPRGAALGLAAALVAIALGRAAARTPAVRAVATGGAAALVLASTAPLVGEQLRALPGVLIDGGSATIAVAAVVAASAQLGRLPLLDRHLAQAIAAGAALIAAVTAASPLLDESAALVLGIAALALVAVRGERPARVVARILLPLAAARLAALTVEALAPPTAAAPPVVAVPVIAAAAALAAVAMTVAVALLASRRTAGTSERAEHDGAPVSGRRGTLTLTDLASGPGLERRAGDAAALAATATILVSALAQPATDASVAWLVLLLAAVVVLVLAISRDGLVGAASPRRHLGWPALALGVAALWSRLAADTVTAPEPYTLPVAGALLLVAAAASRAARGRRYLARSVAPLAGAAVGLALLPSGLHEPLDEPLRGAAVAVMAIAVLVGGMLASARVQQAAPGIGAALAVAGASTLAVGGVAHALALVATANGRVDGQAAPLAGGPLAHAVIAVALPAAVAVAVHLLGQGRVRAGATAGLIGAGALGAGALGLSTAVTTVELVSVPVALGALAVGALVLAERREARSWVWLAPGLVLLLGPSLLAIDGAGEPLWRAVAVGVAAAAVFAVGLWRRLQAPFVLGGSALLIHLLVQSWPLLEQVGRTVEWWLWLGLAGVLVVALAARYERRLQNARDIARRISELR